MTPHTVGALVARGASMGGLPAEDLATVLPPLFRQVAAIHETGRVASLCGLDALSVHADGHLEVDPATAELPTRNPREIGRAEREQPRDVEVERGRTLLRDLSGASVSAEARDVSPEGGAGALAMRIVAGWQRWEHLLGHHDELTDIAGLGELLAALACGLDLADAEDARLLAENHRNLFALNERLHPVVAAVATEMIEPDRRRRGQDLPGLATRLATYRDQPEDFDLERVVHSGAGRRDRRVAVLTHLRERLFDVSRRNPLVHFRPTARSLNLTEASVPLVMDVARIRASQLFTWGGGPATVKLLSGKTLDLGSVVRWDDAPYAGQALDAIIASARRDRAEYGQDQLRLIVAFLRWRDLKNAPDEPVFSPLVLAPATLVRQRGVRDSHRLTLASTEAEINPVLRHQLDELYGFDLPETIDLANEGALAALCADLQRQAQASQPGLTIALADRPRIEIVHHRALVAMQSYRRRRNIRAAATGDRHYAHCYTWPGWSPLGLQIYRDRLDRDPIPLSVEFGDMPPPRRNIVGTAGEMVEQDTFALRTEGAGNPYAWEVDLCSVTVANLNYRMLSLVRDYNALIEAPRPNAAFDEMFSDAPRQTPEDAPDLALGDTYDVVAADGSQAAAVAAAAAGDNFVIQGPPGTGKSQTITNLIADFAARGKRVLFVCQKRAALDVVHARLKAEGLDEFCTLIHDSQQDKKAFVQGLRDTYERWLAPGEPLEDVETRRRALLDRVGAVLDELGGFENALLAASEGTSVIDVIERLAMLRELRWGDDLAPEVRRLLPRLADWLPARASVDALSAALARTSGAGSTLASSPLRLVSPAVLRADQTDAEVAHRASTAVTAIDTLTAACGAADVRELAPEDLPDVAQLCRMLEPLAIRGRVAAFEPTSGAAAQLRRAAAEHDKARSAAAAAAAAAAGWQSPPGPEETLAALEVARRKEGSRMRAFSGEWRRVRALVGERYQPQGHGSSPVTQTLELLTAAQSTRAALQKLSAEAELTWGHPDPATVQTTLAEARRSAGRLGAWATRLAGDPAAAALSERLPDLAERCAAALSAVVAPEAMTEELAGLRDELARLATPEGQALVRAASGPLRELAATSATLLPALRVLDASSAAIEYAVTAAEWARAQAKTPALSSLTGARLEELLTRVSGALPELRRANAAVVEARLRDRFADLAALSQRSVTGMGADERALKKAWSAGRRELENEFGKVRAYKPIRQLASGDAGQVVAALRPVWLMSPASLSETLPLDAAFDVVVFDEASQVPVEQAVPALYRAAQVVVVGDRMQLPPTSYFQARGAGRDFDPADPGPAETTGYPDDDAEDGADAGRISVLLDSDSFLTVSSVRLPSVMLTWHYRSRYEALIQFSNAAFYARRLATVPDREPSVIRSDATAFATDQGDGAEGPTAEDVRAAVDAMLTRSITFLRVLDGVYVQRTNPAEARWIAALVRELLARGTGATIGVVAFSEAQQGEIEGALDVLAAEDPHFAALYEAELNREADGQAVGLFVKNLENVQGDERDVILLSVCYAPGPDGRMRMNFGPINNAGGERRLNVIFSRARERMVVVSTIDHTAITNAYNDGANTLKGFLRYAEAVSAGDAAALAACLAGLGERTREISNAAAHTVAELAAALRERGVEIAEGLGQSQFRVDLALKRVGTPAYVTAVLVDHAARLRAHTLVERRLVQPGALAATGWRVEHVLATEWLESPQRVLDRLVRTVD